MAVRQLLKQHKVAKRAAKLSVKALIKMGHVVKKLHEKGYDEKAVKVLLGASRRLMQEASRLEREAKSSKPKSSKKRR